MDDKPVVTRNTETEVGKRIWKAIDEAADKVPEWLKEELRGGHNE